MSPKPSSFLSNPLLCFVLVGLYPALFLASINWFMYTSSQIWVLLLVTPLSTLILGAVIYTFILALRFIIQKVRKLEAGFLKADTVSRFIGATIAFSMLLFLLQSTIIAPDEASSLLIPLVVIITFLFVFITAKNGFMPLNIMLIVMVLLSSASWLMAINRSGGPSESYWYEENRAVYDSVKLASKPNVYLIVAESYNSQAALERIYGYDNSAFVKSLEELGFNVYPDHYSNYAYTLASLISLFSMEHHYEKVNVGNMDAFGAREVVGGKAYNSVLSIFKNNGYKTQYALVSDYSFIRGDLLDFGHPVRTDARVFQIYQIDLIDLLLAKLTTGFPKLTKNARDHIYGGKNLDKVIEDRIAIASESSAPFFTVFKPKSTQHTNAHKTWRELDDWVDKYPKIVAKGNQVLLGITRNILSVDPSAVIIILGDHGAIRYRGIETGDKDLNGNLKANGLPGSILALDTFGTLLAVKMDGVAFEAFNQTSHVNVFRKLFSLLTEDDAELMKTWEQVSSYRKTDKQLYAAVRDGIALDEWERTTLKDEKAK